MRCLQNHDSCQPGPGGERLWLLGLRRGARARRRVPLSACGNAASHGRTPAPAQGGVGGAAEEHPPRRCPFSVVRVPVVRRPVSPRRSSTSHFRWRRPVGRTILGLEMSTATSLRPGGDGAGVLRAGRLVRRRLRDRRAHDRDLLPSVVSGPQAAAAERRVPGLGQGRPLRGLPAVPALPAARGRRPAAGMGGEAAGRGRRGARAAPARARAARAGHQPRARPPLFPEDLWHDLRCLRARAAAGPQPEEPARGRGPRRGRARRRLRVGERLPRGLRQALRPAARRGARRRVRARLPGCARRSGR